jgi:alanyl-tRNA synthetase
MSGAEIRRAFLEFFADNGHTIVPSSSLVPGGDQTLLFTNAGMVQFKDVFLGQDHRPYKRATTSQRCMRVSGKHNDLENVGPSPRHHTFFEMLGNFSFGDYFKREAITFAYTCLTQVYKLPPERLYFTVHESDEEAYRVWLDDIHVPAERIARMGDKTNFWQMADVGPCGPTAEIHYDFMPDRGALHGAELLYHLDDNPDGRFLEVWNLVFMQFNQAADGSRTPLPAPGVDTGMGLERLAMLVQGKSNTYDTDLFAPILDTIQRLAGHSREQREAMITAYRVVADHARAATFLISDGVVPGNLGRNYVTRMIIRRAARFGSKLGFSEPFLARVAESVVREFGEVYPEIVKSQEVVGRTLTLEENRFRRTVDVGIANLEQTLKAYQAKGTNALSGEDAFRLYATYGLPLEITRDVVRERGMQVDEAGFRAAMDSHREASGAGQAMGELGGEDVAIYRKLREQLVAEGVLPESGVEYDPYSGFEVVEPILAILKAGQRVSEAEVGQTVEIVLGRTCFYLEAGGQVADTGELRSNDPASGEVAWQVVVSDVRRPAAGLIVHVGEVMQGRVRQGELATAAVDDERRWDIMRNHTATHLLHAELRFVLGNHVRQAGSLVAPDRLRFDFTHPTMVSQQDLERIERYVNEAVLADYPVSTALKAREQAIREGAMALFGEKYGETVRTIAIGEPEVFSHELCGGTHVFQTADIGPFLIVSENSVAAGVRRIEAVTGHAAVDLLQQRNRTLQNSATHLGVGVDQLDQKVREVVEDLDRTRREILHQRQEMAQREFEGAMDHPQSIAGIPVVTASVALADADTLRLLADAFRKRYPTGVVAVAAAPGGKPTLVVGVSEDLVQRGLNAGDLARAAAKILGGGGGGRPTLAQAGGTDPTRMAEALQAVSQLVAGALS